MSSLLVPWEASSSSLRRDWGIWVALWYHSFLVPPCSHRWPLCGTTYQSVSVLQEWRQSHHVQQWTEGNPHSQVQAEGIPRRHHQDCVLQWLPGDQVCLREGQGQRRDGSCHSGLEVAHPQTQCQALGPSDSPGGSPGESEDRTNIRSREASKNRKEKDHPATIWGRMPKQQWPGTRIPKPWLQGLVQMQHLCQRLGLEQRMKGTQAGAWSAMNTANACLLSTSVPF